MAGIGDTLRFSVTSMVEDVLQQHGKQLCEVNFTPENDEEVSTNRNEAAGWLRKTVGVVAAKDLPAEPSDEDFKQGLRSGIILCNVLNKIQPGAVSKVVEAPFDSVIVNDGTPLSTCQYYENIRNFLVAIEEMGIPTFEASDLEQGGKSSRVVNCVLALKSYSDWKKAGANGTWKYERNTKPSAPKSSGINGDKPFDMEKCRALLKELNEETFPKRLRELLSDRKPEEIPIIVENMLSKLTEEFEHRLATHNEQIARRAVAEDSNRSHMNESLPRTRNRDIKPTSDTHNEKEGKASWIKEGFVKPSPSDTHNEKEGKASWIKEGFIKSFSSDAHDKEEKASSEIKKEEYVKPSFGDTHNKNEEKVSSEIKTEEYIKPSSSDTHNKNEGKVSSGIKVEEFVKPSSSDTHSKKEERVNPWIKKEESVKPSSSDTHSKKEERVNPWMKKEESVKPSCSDTHSKKEERVSPWMKKEESVKPSSSDTHSKKEERVSPWMKKEESVKPSSSDTHGKKEERVISGIKKEDSVKPSSSDTHSKKDERVSPWMKEESVKPSSSDTSGKKEERVISGIKKEESVKPSTSDTHNKKEEKVSSEIKEESIKPSSSDTHNKKEEKVSSELKEEYVEASSSDISDQMEESLSSETEEEEDIKHSSSDLSSEMEDDATEDAANEEYDSWIDAQCMELKAKAAKQQVLVEHQHKELQELKNTLSTAKADMQLLQTNYQEEVNNLGKHLRSLAQAAAGYKKVVEENRKLYNQVQDMKGNIRVYCRVRPFLGGQGNRPSAVDCTDEVTIAVITPTKGGKETRKAFTFNRVFGPTATQGEVFSDTQPLIRSVLDGYNVCIFAYGQTGSGKTFTMSGPDDLTPETMGVNYRALNDLFQISDQRKNMIAYDVSVQMLEIYNEQVRDLLMTDGVNKRLEIRNGTQKGINVPDANLVPVSTTEDVINLMNLGHKNRAVGSTAMNDRSSRSHSCLTVHVNGRDLTSGTTVRGCMHLVDLAGSERADKTEAVGDRLKEAQHINKSLSALGDVISSLAQKNAHVPYRNSKLTQLLQDALGGQAKTLMFIHVSPDPDTVGETISTLKFAERVSTVELGAAKTNKDNIDLKELKEQVASLKAALAKKEGGDHQEELGNTEQNGAWEDSGSTVTDESDDRDTTSNGVASKLKKPSPAQARSPQNRNLTSATQPRKASAGATGAPASKVGRQQSALDARKRTGK